MVHTVFGGGILLRRMLYGAEDDFDGDENSAVPNIELEVMATTNDEIPLQEEEEDDEKEQDIFELDL